MSPLEDTFGDWLQHSVTVEVHQGVTATGDSYTAPVTVDKLIVEEKRRTVIGSDGTTQFSEAQLFCDVSKVGMFRDKSKVTLPSGRVAYVLAVTKLDIDGLPSNLTVYVS